MKKAILETLTPHREELTIGPFSKMLQPLIEESLSECNQEKVRKGTFLTPIFVMWIVLTSTLRRDLNYHKVIEFLVKPLRWLCLSLPHKLLGEGVLSRARVKQGILVFKLLFQKMVARLIVIKTDFHGMTSVAFDGMMANMPDTESNRKKFGSSSNQSQQGAFPMMRIVSLVLLSSHLIIDAAYAPYRGKKTGEQSLMLEIFNRLNLKGKNFLFHFDALYYSFALAYQMQQTHQHFLIISMLQVR